MEKARQGEEIIIKRVGTPVAVITRHEPSYANRKPGAFRGF